MGCSDDCSSEAACLGISPVLNAGARALHSASCALPAARRDGPGVAGFVRLQSPATRAVAQHRVWLLRAMRDRERIGLGVTGASPDLAAVSSCCRWPRRS
jgi:hypothetical protein